MESSNVLGYTLDMNDCCCLATVMQRIISNASKNGADSWLALSDGGLCSCGILCSLYFGLITISDHACSGFSVLTG